ncbi:hypothetical protein ACLMJK_000237 [Lecanora helva]
MARLAQMTDSDDDDADLPELSTIFRYPGNVAEENTGRSKFEQSSSIVSSNARPSGQVPRSDCKDSAILRNLEVSSMKTEKRTSSNQRRLGPFKPLHPNAVLLSTMVRADHDDMSARRVSNSLGEKSTRKVTSNLGQFEFSPGVSDAEPLTDLSDFIVSDSASENDVLPRHRQRKLRDPKTIRGSRDIKKNSSNSTRSPLAGDEDTGPIDLTSPTKCSIPKFACVESSPLLKTPPGPANFSDDLLSLEEPLLQTGTHPPVQDLFSDTQDLSRPVTPPPNPQKGRLKSPSRRSRVPRSPHHPSIDDFWSSDVINDWNEQYSSRKSLLSPRKSCLFLVEEDGDQSSPSKSSRKRSPCKSFVKKEKKPARQQKAFKNSRHELGTSFLAELDRVVGNGQIGALTESTGGIKILWSKKLSCTAGRANWRMEVVRSKEIDGTAPIIKYQHHASIELAEKVIDDEDRLTNVLAHEYCHLTNFMISGIKDQPHGASFKSWAAKVTRAFSHRGINVTTKHTYEIAYKYVWVCSSEVCHLEYKRHSKSIDPLKHLCGSCKSKLVQVKPKPRRHRVEGNFQDFIKNQHEKVRKENPGKSLGEIMVVLGKEFREVKNSVTDLEDFEKEAKSSDIERGIGADDINDVTKKLEFLKLKS